MKKRIYALLVLIMILSTLLTGCEFLDSKAEDISGALVGTAFDVSFYTNKGELYMTASGEQITLTPNIIKERTYDPQSGWRYIRTLSSVVTITIDGHEIETCGSTAIFAEEGLKPDVNFTMQDINSEADGFGDLTAVAGIVNSYKNMFGKSRVVVIQGQLGDPICAYSGESVYYEVCQNLPKTTKLSIDGKVLYIHRANFQIIDKELLDN